MATTLYPELSKKMRFFAFVSMLLLVFVHGYNLNERYLQPFSTVNEPMTFNAFFQYFTANGLLRFRIPMLFVISGYLYALHDHSPNKKRLVKRFRTLMVPYFLWSAIGLLIAFVMWKISWTHQAVINSHLQPTNHTFDQYTPSDWFHSFLWPTSYQLWFIRCLFFYNLLYPVLKWAVLRIPSILFTILTVLWIFLFGLFVIEGEGLLFFSLGIWLCKRDKDVQLAPKWFSIKWALPVLIILCAFKTWWAFHGIRWLQGFPLGFSLVIMHKIVVALGLLVAWFGLEKLARNAMENKWFNSACSYGFIIYALHVPIVTYLIDPSLSLFHGTPHARLVVFILLPLLLIFFCMLVGYIMRKTMLPVYSILTGGRGL
jgi:fucose 4-O-acetylase-like acetyltransferase